VSAETDRAIPQPVGMDGWQHIAIGGRDESLISLSALSDRIALKPAYFLQGIAALS